jgi:hypothetical protein
MRKLEYGFVKSKVESFGCQLLSEIYINTSEKLKILFICGHEGYRSYTNFLIKNKVCSDCSRKDAGLRRRRDIQTIRNTIESYDCEWTDGLYEGNDSKLQIKFQCGHISERTYDSFLVSEKICSDCMNKKNGLNRRNDIQEVKEYIESRGCEWIDGEYKGNSSKLKILFSCGHIGKRSYAKFKEGYPICSDCAGVGKYEFDKVFDIFKINGYTLTSESYSNCKLPLNFEDAEGYKYTLSFDKFKHNILERKSVPSRFDKNNPNTIDNLVVYLKINCPILHLSEGQKWTGNDKKLSFYDEEGYKYYVEFGSLQSQINGNSFPGKFDVSNIYTLDNIQKWIDINNKPFHLVEGQTYKGGHKKLKFKCHICHRDEIPFLSCWADISQEKGCGLCSCMQIGNFNNLAYLRPDISREWNFELNYPVRPEEVASHAKNKYYWTCNDCGKSYPSSVSKRTGNEPRGCPYCSESNMEKRIRNYFENNNIIYAFQKRFNDCKDLLSLPFDFYLPDYNVACEAQGIQHFEIVDFFGGEEAFIDRKKKDKIKENYCKENNIPFIEIPYYKFNNIENILEEQLARFAIENLQEKEVYA